MTIYDTNVVINKARRGERIDGDITVITLIEYPRIIYYKKFKGNVKFPVREDYILAHKLQLKLIEKGKPQQATDLIIAAITLRLGEKLVTMDRDFEVIAEAARELGYEFKLEVIV
ncbi:MAG: hypothetical protein F7B17_00520 [Desulfurococcales archaeon]|nr:hypothetical protein [Desulfurococcales archaeon]